MRRYRLLALLLLAVSPVMNANDNPPATEPGKADMFEREALQTLKDAFANKRGVNLHVNGSVIGGAVVAIGPDVIVMQSREYGRIVVRRERIDAIQAN